MDQFVVLSKSHKGCKIIDDIIKEVSNPLSKSPKSEWMIPHQTARTKMMASIFYDFVIYESLLKPYKHMSTIMYKSNKQNKIIGYGLMTNHQINPMNSINEDENKYFVFIKLFITILKYTLLTPLRIGFSNCFAIILFYYNQYLYNKSMFKNITKSIEQTDSNNNNNTFSFGSNTNIIQLDYIIILNNYRRHKNGTKLLKYLINEIYDGYDESNNNAPCIYIECNSQSLLFYRKLGFEIVGIIDNIYYNRNYRVYSMLYHKNREKLNEIVNYTKELFQQDNTLYVNVVGLSFDFGDDDRSNIHFKWSFPPNNITEFIIYLFKFGILTFFINKFEQIFNFNTLVITNYTICQWIVKFLCLFVLFWCCFPLLVGIILLRKFKIGAWDV